MSRREGVLKYCAFPCVTPRKSMTRTFPGRRKTPFKRSISRRTSLKVKCLDDVTQALRDAGLRNCGLIVGIDFTSANDGGGRASFSGRNLHDLNAPSNPFVMNLGLIPRALEGLDGECRMFGYGFGDSTTRDRSVFPFFPEQAIIKDHRELLERYRQVVPFISLSAPMSCAALIRQAMRRVFQSLMEFHVLLVLIAAPISPNCRAATIDAIFHASYFPISIVMIGVGDGPWGEMHNFKEDLPGRRWDNFSFIEFKEFKKLSKMSQAAREKNEAKFALKVLEKLPQQFASIREFRGPIDQQSVQNIVSRIPDSILVGSPQMGEEFRNSY